MSDKPAKRRPAVKAGDAPKGKDIKAKMNKPVNGPAPEVDPKPTPKPKAKD